MVHLGTKTLDTKNLILRPFRVEDGPAMYRNWANDPEVTKYLTWPTHSSPQSSTELLRQWTAEYQTPNYYTWAIVLKNGKDEPIGSISVVNQINPVLKVAEIGYCIGKQWWHQGITTEALQAVIDYLLGQVQVNKVAARHDTNNPHSGAVMRKCHMRYEGTLRQSAHNNQGIVDMTCYGILREEWERL